MTDTLKPCPFCPQDESDVWMEIYKRGRLAICNVTCHNCDCEGPPATTENEAIAKWNTRAGDGTKHE